MWNWNVENARYVDVVDYCHQIFLQKARSEAYNKARRRESSNWNQPDERCEQQWSRNYYFFLIFLCIFFVIIIVAVVYLLSRALVILRLAANSWIFHTPYIFISYHLSLMTLCWMVLKNVLKKTPFKWPFTLRWSNCLFTEHGSDFFFFSFWSRIDGFFVHFFNTQLFMFLFNISLFFQFYFIFFLSVQECCMSSTGNFLRCLWDRNSPG